MNVFTKDLGLHQGRIPLANAPEGSFVYELGHALLGDGAVNVGDHHEITQVFTVTAGSKYITASIRVRVPPALPVGAAWVVSASLNGTQMVQRRLRIAKRLLVLEDWAISLASAHAAPTTNTLALRLELV